MGMWLWRWLKMRYLVMQLCRWHEYTIGKSASKLKSSQKQNCNILTQLSGICRVLGRGGVTKLDKVRNEDIRERLKQVWK